jgi:hypothetical protein
MWNNDRLSRPKHPWCACQQLNALQSHFRGLYCPMFPQNNKIAHLRLSLGATRGDIVRQILGDGLTLASAGGALAVLLAVWGGHALLAFLPFATYTTTISTARITPGASDWLPLPPACWSIQTPTTFLPTFKLAGPAAAIWADVASLQGREERGVISFSGN